MRPKPRRVLIVQPYGIGDLLFLTPIFRALRLLPSVEIVDVLLGSRTESVIRSNPHLDKIFSHDRGRAQKQSFKENLADLWKLGQELRGRRYDTLLDFSLRGEYAFLGQFFLGIQHRAGFAYKDRAIFHNLRVPLPEGFQTKHVAEYAADVALKAGIPVRDRFLEFYVRPEDREAASHYLKEKTGFPQASFLAVSAGGGESWGKDAHFKRWPPAFFADLINQLKARVPLEFAVILGSRGERELGDEMVKRIGVPAVNGCGELSLETSAALLEKSVLFLGNDGGLMHLAGALHRPVIGLYGPVDPAVYGPYPADASRLAVTKDLECRPCYKRFRYNSACETRACLQDLKPQEVLEFLERKDFFKTVSLKPVPAA